MSKHDQHVVGSEGGMTGGLDENTKEWKVYQDEKPFIEQAKLDREAVYKRDMGYKKACTIPDIVAIDILHKYGIDIHDQTFMNDRDKVRKVLTIIKTEYPHLMSY
ncbi:MAG: hypothetical protein GDA45_07355 [Chromatiales bacterium]|nr:hypothetical protein [Chromatiales bacterium]